MTEGSSGIWERLHYDWSDPYRIVIGVTDSNVWGGASGYTYILTANTDGTTNVDVVIVREGRNLKGRFFAAVFKIVGKKLYTKSLGQTVKAIETRNAALRAL